MAASQETYACRVTDTGGYLAATLGDLQTFTSKIWFVAKHVSDTGAPLIRVEGTVDNPSTGAVSVNLAPSNNGFRVGVYDSHWEAEDSGGLLWALPTTGGDTLEILESLK
jgi:hypothetical protein